MEHIFNRNAYLQRLMNIPQVLKQKLSWPTQAASQFWGWVTDSSSLCPPSASSPESLWKGTDLIMRAPPPNTITLGAGALAYAFGGNAV